MLTEFKFYHKDEPSLEVKSSLPTKGRYNMENKAIETSLVENQAVINDAINKEIERTRKFLVSHLYKPKSNKTSIFREQTREAMAERFENEAKNNVEGAITVITRKLIRSTIAASLSNAGNVGVSKVTGLAPRKQRRAEAKANKQSFEPQYN